MTMQKDALMKSELQYERERRTSDRCDGLELNKDKLNQKMV